MNFWWISNKLNRWVAPQLPWMLKDGKRIGVVYSVHLLVYTVQCALAGESSVQCVHCALCSYLKWCAVIVCSVVCNVVCKWCAVLCASGVQCAVIVCIVMCSVHVECIVQLLGSNWQDHPLASALLTHSASLILTAEWWASFWTKYHKLYI